MVNVEDRVGKRFESTRGGWFEVVGLVSNGRRNEYRIRFDHDGYETVTTWQNICKGKVRNPFYPVYNGLGYTGHASTHHPLFQGWVWKIESGAKMSDALTNFANYVDLVESLDGYDEATGQRVERIDPAKEYAAGNLRLV